MARTVSIVLTLDDKGSVEAAKFFGGFERGAERMARSAEAAGKRMRAGLGNAADQVTARFLRYGAVTTSVLGGLATRAVLRYGTQFEKSFSGVQAVTQATEEELAALKAEAKEMGATTAYSAGQAAATLETMGRAGFEATEQIRLLPDVLNLAAAGELQLAEAGSIASDIVRGMGVEVGKFGYATDVLAASAANANQDVRDIGSSFKYVSPLAREMDVSLASTSATISTLANRGIRAEMAGTSLRGILAVLRGELEEGEKGVAAYSDQLFDQEGRFLGVANAIDVMSKAQAEGLNIMEAFGKRAGPAMLALIQAGSDNLREFTAMLENSHGAAKQMADTRLDNLAGDVMLLKSAGEGLALALYEKALPGLRELVQSMTGVTQQAIGFAETTNVLGAMGRVAKVAGVAIAAMVGIGLYRRIARVYMKFRQTRLELIQMRREAIATGLAFQDMGRKASMAKLGMAGMSGGIAIVAAEAALAIAELTGLDQAIADLIADADHDLSESAASFGAQVGYIQQVLAKAGETEIGPGGEFITAEQIARAAELVETIEKFKDARLWAGAAEAAREELEKMGADLAKAEKGVRGFHHAMREVADENRDLWEQAGEETENATERLGRYNELLAERGEAQRKAAEEAEQAAEKERLALAAVQKGIEKALRGTGLVSEKVFDDIQQHWQRVFTIADAQGISDNALAKSLGGDLEELQRILDATGQTVEGRLGDLLETWNVFQQEALRSEALRDMEEDLLSVGYVSEETAHRMQDSLLLAIRALTAEAKGTHALEVFAAANAEALISLGAAAETSGVALDPLIESAVELAEAFKDSEQATALTRDRLQELAAFVQAGDLEASTAAIGENIALSMSVAGEAGAEYNDVLMFHREELELLIERYEYLGASLPEWLEGARVSLEALGEQEQLRALLDDLEQGFDRIKDRAIGGIGQAVGAWATGTAKLSESLKRLWKSVAAQTISHLVQIGLRRLILGKISTGAEASEASATMSKSLGAVYANTFASVAGAPFPISLTAPVVAATHLAMASTGAAAAAATGSGLGSGMVPQLAEGGIVNRSTFVEIGERGREAVVPLQGQEARRAAREMGIGQPSPTLIIEEGAIQVHAAPGQDGVSLAREVYDELTSLIQGGLLAPLPTRVR